jgi:putative copper export protein
MTEHAVPLGVLVAARFIVFLSHALLFGLVPIALLVLRPAFAAAAIEGVRRDFVARRAESLMMIALIVALLGAALGLLTQALDDADLRGVSLGLRSFEAVLATSPGQLHVLRAPLILALGVLLMGRGRSWLLAGTAGPEAAAPRRWWAVWLILAAALLATVSRSGHAAGHEWQAVAVTNDVCHLAAGAAWITGIVGLTYLLPGAWRGRDEHAQLSLLAPAVDRFSRVAFWSIMVVIVTGVINSLLHLGAFGNLFDTDYGRTLVVKLSVFVFILALGGLNHFRLRMRLLRALESGEPSRHRRALRRNVAAELALGLILIVAASFLISFPPPPD